MKDDTVYLKHISDALVQVQTYLLGKSFEEFISNKMLQDAVIRQLEIIGEATRNVTDDFRNAINLFRGIRLLECETE